MDILKLIDRSNKMFELLEYTNRFDDYDEIVSLKISLNNLLVSLDSEEPNFFEILLLSSPVLFDFAFNSNLEPEYQQIRNTFERQKYYEEAKKWYKFIRNSLIHTNRYTYNNFLKSIYRIEYDEAAVVYFELDEKKSYRFEEFKTNRYYIENDKYNQVDSEPVTYEFQGNVRLEINYHYFRKYMIEMISNFIRSLEHDVDQILSNEVNKWNNYYILYKQLINEVYWDRNLNLKLVRRLKKSLVKLKDFDLEEAYVLCEFLVYMSDLDVALNEEMIADIIERTTFDKYYQLENRSIIFNQISSVKNYPKVYVNYDQVAWILNEIYPLSSEHDQSLQILEHTNYLIMYVQKYLAVKGVRNEQSAV